MKCRTEDAIIHSEGILVFNIVFEKFKAFHVMPRCHKTAGKVCIYKGFEAIGGSASAGC